MAFLLADDHYGHAINFSEAADHGFIVAYVAVAVEFYKLAAHFFNILQGIGPVWVPAQLYTVPGGKVLGQVLFGFNDLFFELGDGPAHIGF